MVQNNINRPEADEDDDSPEAVVMPYARKTPRNMKVMFAIVFLLAVIAVGGIVMAVTGDHEDPAAVKMPEHTTRSLADDQPVSSAFSNEPQAMQDAQHDEVIVPQEQEGNAAYGSSPAEHADEPEQTETPLDLNKQTPIPEVKPGKPEKDKVLVPEEPVAPQSMIQWDKPVLASAKPSTAITPQQPKATALGHPAQIVIVIDDMGLNVRNSRAMVAMPAPVTLAYMPYAQGLKQQTDAAYKNGHELIVHMPMEPDDVKHNNPGPDALLSTLPAAENVARLKRNLSGFDTYIGLNNHMGSKMTADPKAIRPILQVVKERGLWFLDSRTIGNSVAGKIAGELGIPYAERDVFLDNVMTVSAVNAQLKQLENIARKRGYAIAIGHPHDATIAALKAWIPQAKANGFEFVSLSTVISERFPNASMPRYAQTPPDKKMPKHMHASANLSAHDDYAAN